jgi:hypothetical protein
VSATYRFFASPTGDDFSREEDEAGIRLVERDGALQGRGPLRACERRLRDHRRGLAPKPTPGHTPDERYAEKPVRVFDTHFAAQGGRIVKQGAAFDYVLD